MERATMIYDNHTHLARFSRDAAQDIGQLLAAADSAGLPGIMTADHYEKDIFYDGIEDVYPVHESFELLQPIRDARPAGACKLLIGIELGFLPHLAGHLEALTRSFPFDGVILSLHVLDGKDPYTDFDLYREEKTSLYGRYFRRMAEMVEQCADFDMVAHFDYISRLGRYPDRKIYYAENAPDLDLLLQALVNRGKALEINTKTVLYLKNLGYAGEACWPDPAIVRRYRELGGEMISLGSDASPLKPASFSVKALPG
jgi:histidinol-phosphatase (PHP family)